MDVTHRLYRNDGTRGHSRDRCENAKQNGPKDQRILDQEFLHSMIQEKKQLVRRPNPNIFKIQKRTDGNIIKIFRIAPLYKINDLVVIKRTQLGGGLKLRPKFLGPYQSGQDKPHDRLRRSRIRISWKGLRLPLQLIT
ncbi:hypothetical protein HNY73_017595 [Argiope bruennichi]|uniref:Uncharacterized protein n=1 Tax=Argiope bruennichi TaxID=94029 RepID=A0A8T0EBJ7_ARGBR|nr:hypothetical protein HNY73_017595 [Argiope bruennichi]